MAQKGEAGRALGAALTHPLDKKVADAVAALPCCNFVKILQAMGSPMGAGIEWSERRLEEMKGVISFSTTRERNSCILCLAVPVNRRKQCAVSLDQAFEGLQVYCCSLRDCTTEHPKQQLCPQRGAVCRPMHG